MSIDDFEGNDIVQNAGKKLCIALQSEDKFVRKLALKEFAESLKPMDHNELHCLFKEVHIYLLNTLRDRSEPVREQAIQTLQLYILEKLPINDYYISYLFPIFIERIGSVEIVEESEEIRLQLLHLIHGIIDKYSEGSQLKAFLNDLVIILKETVKDKYPAIKEMSCKCIILLSKYLPRDFHMQAESLVKPVLGNFSHQRYKIRIDAIQCMEVIVLASSCKALEEVAGPMAERLFDQIPAVRRTVARVAARWLLEYRDRYSFFYKLLPLLLTGLNDEVPETRAEAHTLWLQVGLQYQRENEKDFKDELDFLTQLPKHYPKDLERPNLGCRVLVQRTIGKLTSALARELSSWQADVRVRCSQLLCAVAHHAEDGITQHLQELLVAMYATARDEDERVVVNIVRASQLIGTFVPVDTWKKLILPAIEDGAHYGHLTVLANLIRGAPQDLVCSELREISQLLVDPNVCQSRKARYQKELINCVNSIEDKYSDELSGDIGSLLFRIVATVFSIRDKENDEVLDERMFQRLSDVLKLDNVDDLWKIFLGDLLKSLNGDPKGWTEVTVDRCILETILAYSNASFGQHLGVIGAILVDALDLSVEPEARLRTFIALTEALDKKDVIFKNAINLQIFLETLITDAIKPTLVWHAGRTAEAMRTMATSCLCTALSPAINVDLFTKELLQTLSQQIIPLLLSLTEDGAYRSRHLSLEALVLLKNMMVVKEIWGIDDLIKIYPEILKRLDDPISGVRICSVESISILLEDIPEEFKGDTFKSHHEFIIDTLMIHFDDDEMEFQELIKGVFKVLVKFCKQIVEEKVLKHKPLIRNQDGCDEIIKYIQQIEL